MENILIFNFGTRVEELLNERNIKYSDFCKAVGIIPQSLYDWKKKSQTPNALTALKVAKFFGVSVEYLLTGNRDNMLQDKVDELRNKLEQISKLCNTY